MKITIELDVKEFAELTAATESPAKSSDNTRILQKQFELLSKICENTETQGMERYVSPKDLAPITQAMLSLHDRLNLQCKG